MTAALSAESVAGHCSLPRFKVWTSREVTCLRRLSGRKAWMRMRDPS